MRTLLSRLDAAGTRYPRRVLMSLVVATLGFAVLASTNEFEVDITQLGRDDAEAAQALDRVQEDFVDPSATVQVILDAGPGANVLTTAGFDAAAHAEDIAVDALGPDARDGDHGGTHVTSLGTALREQGVDPAAAGEDRLGASAAELITSNPRMAALVSDDVDLEDGSARAMVLVLGLDPGLSKPERIEAGERVQAAFEDGDPAALGDMRVTVFSLGLFDSGMLDAVQSEAPMLFAIALLVVLAVLALMYRSVFDVLVGFAGLLCTVVWTFGIAALLGPAHLGWTGPLTQLAIVVPVLLVGLGIDYSVHLTARYREQLAAGANPADAAGRALHTVGIALILATVATAAGFATTATAPVPMIADFGVFVAVGVLCAFAIMTLLVPAARVLRDRDGARQPGRVREIGLGRLVGAPVALARRAPALGLAVATLLTLGSVLAATDLDTEFDRDDFVPTGSDIEATLTHQKELFGSGVTESTYAVVDGDFTDPDLTAAIRQAHGALADVPDVRTVGGAPQATSIVSLAARTGADVTGGGDLAAVYDRLRGTVGEQQVGQFLSADDRAGLVHIRTTAGDSGAERLRAEIENAFTPVADAGASVAVTSEPIIINGMNDDLGRFQARAIVLTLSVVLGLLVAYYTAAYRRPVLGVIAMTPAVAGASWILGTMWLLGISFNALTATLTAIAIGIGVPYGVHVVNRFTEDRGSAPAGDAIARTLRNTGGALVGSAVTTLGALVVLSLSNLPPIQSLGVLGGAAIAFALLAATLVAPGMLVLWARSHDGSRRG
ncbi:hydrophobe/amphiphile efflux-3 (HAE3) family protein [Haloechinothrix alba]|uniref:Hydrophobe/amphiphile efflux-3 (HAE3) family protein n=2 Tax=Haloechinothrix alba TaxID=664784 RepID=A0A238W7H5_9PSEU|nr:hydrophobe/amphiphile efflux-3 (HAE3) family protein [Haloechinothrix alba]